MTDFEILQRKIAALEAENTRLKHSIETGEHPMTREMLLRLWGALQSERLPDAKAAIRRYWTHVGGAPNLLR